MKMSFSDWKWLSLLSQSQARGKALAANEVYRACAAAAVNGQKLIDENQLACEYLRYLDIRREIHSGELERAKRRLSLRTEKLEILEGDRHFLMGIIAHRQGDLSTARLHFESASIVFYKANEVHRGLRALINAEICLRDLPNAVTGKLASLRSEALREGCYDLAANVERAAAIELMCNGLFAPALASVQKAIEHYDLDGCPEDRAVAICLLAILQFMNGDFAAAESAIIQVHDKTGKIAPYAEAYRSLVAGRNPKLPEGHPIHGVPWERQSTKLNSIPGKILNRLRQGPAARDQLIECVWGSNATHPSYHSRLYSAIKFLRKNVSVVSDGEFYRLA